jgi:alanyl-tRNA synthetase
MEGYDREMEAQRKRSGDFSGSGEATTDHVYHELSEKVKADNVEILFTGYESVKESDSKLLYVVHEGEIKSELDSNSEKMVELVFDKTPFYAESGGQVGDTGKISGDAEVSIQDTQKPVDGLFVMKGVLKSGALKSGSEYTLEVNQERRKKIVLNHSGTHLLHSALRKVLGEHIKQAGSHVSEDRLRFDYTHFQQVTKDQLREIEDLVDKKIKDSITATKEVLPKEEALKKGAIAFFGDKYGDKVRVVTMSDFSVEFCGGTHVDNTAEIGVVKIVSDQSISSGVRRLEAVTSAGVIDWLSSMSTNFDGMGSLQETKSSINKELNEINSALTQLNSFDEKASSEFGSEVDSTKDLVAALDDNFKSLMNSEGVKQEYQKFSQDNLHPEVLVPLKQGMLKSNGEFFADLRAKQTSVSKLRKSIDKKLKSFQQKKSSEQAGDWLSEIKVISTSKGDVNLLVKKIDLDSPKALRETADQVLSKMKTGVVVFGLPQGGKGHLLVAADKDTVAKGFHSGNALKSICEKMNGRGGGKPHLAQGGGEESGLDSALSEAEAIITSQF